MTQDDEDRFLMQQLAPANIVGVHNYCDGWCDRCGFAGRCVVNRSSPPEPKAQVEDSLIDHLKDRFDQVRTLVARRSTFDPRELLKDIGEVDLDVAAECTKQEERRQHRRAHDPIIREARTYGELARAWFDVESGGMRAHADALVGRAAVESVDEISLGDLARMLDAIEIVRHDCFLIYVKLRRAIDGLEEDRDARWSDPIQNDYNGSAKLALTCIDRSEGSWLAIDRWYPSCGGARALADQLAALRTAVEQRLPRARAFLRPGVDGLMTSD
jgi:hypothetical protein